MTGPARWQPMTADERARFILDTPPETLEALDLKAATGGRIEFPRYDSGDPHYDDPAQCLRYLASSDSPPPHLHLVFRSRRLEADCVAAIGALARQAPLSLTLFDVDPTASDIRDLTQQLNGSQVDALDLVIGNLNGAGEELSKFISSLPKLRTLNLSSLLLKDEDWKAVTPAVTSHPELVQVQAEFNRTNHASLEDFTDAALAGKSTRLRQLKVTSEPPAIAEQAVERAYIRHLRPSMPIIDGRNATVNRISIDLAMDTPVHSIATIMAGNAGSKEVADVFGFMVRPDKQPHEQAVWDKTSPRLPNLQDLDGGGLDGLFQTRQSAYQLAPLDNPALFPDAAAASSFVQDLDLTPELLARRTRHGSGILDAAAVRLEPAALIGLVNQQGASLRSGSLLDKDGSPSRLFLILAQKGGGSHVLDSANVIGLPAREARSWRDALRRKLPEQVTGQWDEPALIRGTGRR